MTRKAEYYDTTFEYMKELGIEVLEQHSEIFCK